MMRQCRLINYSECDALVGDVYKGGDEAWLGGEDKRENCNYAFQFCCELKVHWKSKVINKHVSRGMWGSCACVCGVCGVCVSCFSHLTAVERVTVKGVRRPLDASVFFSVWRASPAPALPSWGIPGQETRHSPLPVAALVAMVTLCFCKFWTASH